VTPRKVEITMAKFDVYDEAIINAKPEIVYQTLMSGVIYDRLGAKRKRIKGSAAVEIGTVTEMTLPGRVPTKFIVETVEIIKNKMWHTQYIGGTFRGEGKWNLEPIDDGNTKISYHWRTSPSGLMLRLLAPLINIPKQHSAIMKEFFSSLNEYIKEQEHNS
jgi:carbon monoxide dehydrogenase subunit G